MHNIMAYCIFISARRMIGINSPKPLQLSIENLQYDLHQYRNLINLNLLYRYQYQKKVYCMYHIRQEENSIGVTLP